MKRSWDLIREILTAFESDEFIPYLNRAELSTEQMSALTDSFRKEADPKELEATKAQRRKEIWLHVELLTDCGLLAGSGFETSPSNNGMRITMVGYDMLDALRNDSLWNKIKKQAVKGGVGVTWAFINAAIPVLMGRLARLD